MTPMPHHIMPIQTAYANLMREVYDAIEGIDMTPEAALILAFVGDQEICAAQIMTRGYYIGTNISYNLKRLEAAGFIRKERGSDRRSKRVTLTKQGLALSEHIRNALSKSIDLRRMQQEAA